MLLWRSGINGGTTQFWREIDCMMMDTLMSGTQGEKAHIVYNEEYGSHMREGMIIILICLFRLLAFFSCFVEIVVLFSTGCSRAGIPPLSLRGLLGEY